MNRSMLAVVSALALIVPSAARAQLAQGARAPDFTAQGALAGKPFGFHLKQALKRGPVVLYFYPKAFTQGCTLEAHAFAEASGDFRKAGATVVGMSNDDVATLTKFSTEACRDKFAVAAATPQVISAYDVDLKRDGVSTGLTMRTSYVIGRDGRVVLVHSDMDYRDHVKLTLAAVQKLRARR
ncbi:peroxiredoxin [Novosphingobium sp. KCTC 2891]|uniref:peroxiredoxin n=1 Tax=Novosphingobium sp. KCTC 2891 TaxID=2989730 RepID=UPI002223D518|nr:peroxiredoxin [Novosphingobium sp. KCTC 2891]MCW1381718.1 peroxiredoxin [Novosphingobium sp. KCTC 2891]